MKNKIFLLIALALIPLSVFGHAGHDKEVGVFNPPHNGAFTKFAGDYAEIYLSDGKINFCFVEGNGKSPDENRIPQKIVLVVTPKRSPKPEKIVTLKADSAGTDGCVSWDFSTQARLVHVDITAEIGGESFSADLMYESTDL